ncbi:MAG: hypothetical protein QMD50_03095 [Patescibacteria group bacterium]|nr:hypothetical protein [Patescibacteria group bacterium]
MKTKYLISFVILSFALIYSTLLFINVSAQTNNDGVAGLAQIVYPIPELGNCGNEKACKSYCDKPENLDACLKFAEQHNLMSQGELATAKKFMAAGTKGPGGCNGKEACEEYCNDISRIDECITFAEKNGLIPPEELNEAKKVQAAIKRGVKPPPCGNKKQCDVYCEEPSHTEECVTFGIEAGFIQGKELEDVQKMLAALKRGVKPPACHGKEACDKYCSDENHFEECINFAAAAGFMGPKELEMAKKTKGKGPGGCRGKEECDAFCSKDENMQVCMAFAEEHGLVSKEEAEMMRKTGGKGPGGCTNKESCEAFCNNPENQEICFNFAKERGMIPPEQLRQMEKGKQRFQESINQAPPQVMDCLNSTVGASQMDKFKSGTVMPSQQIGDKIRECFEKSKNIGPSNEGQSNQGFGPMMGPGFSGGPGGCKTPEECKTYCETHQDECMKFQPSNVPGTFGPNQIMQPSQGMDMMQVGPGGCRGPEECELYCEAHQEECSNFAPSSDRVMPSPGTMFPPTSGDTKNFQLNNQMMPGIAGPGGCKDPAGCKTYCETHQDECKNFITPTQGQTGPALQNFMQGVMQMVQPPTQCEGENCKTILQPQEYSPEAQYPYPYQGTIMPPQQNMMQPPAGSEPMPGPGAIFPSTPEGTQSPPPMPPSSLLLPNPFATLLMSLFGVFLGR